MNDPRFREILRRLADENVEAIVVGMAAGVLQGVPTTTWDLDIVHRRTHENVQRLLRVLKDVDAVARGDPRHLRPSASHLMGSGHILMETRFGDFDCLCVIDDGCDYERLFDDSHVVDVDGRAIRILGLSKLIEIKKRAGRPKDLAAIPYLEATLDEIQKRNR